MKETHFLTLDKKLLLLWITVSYTNVHVLSLLVPDDSYPVQHHSEFHFLSSLELIIYWLASLPISPAHSV